MKLATKDGATTGGESPVVQDMFPKEVYDQITIKRSFSLGLHLKMSAIDTAIEPQDTVEFIRYEPQIVSFGRLQSEAYWDFSVTKSKDAIVGDKELFVIVRVPKGRKAVAKFLFGAEVKTPWGCFPMKVRKRRRKEASFTADEYLVCYSGVRIVK